MGKKGCTEKLYRSLKNTALTLAAPLALAYMGNVLARSVNEAEHSRYSKN